MHVMSLALLEQSRLEPFVGFHRHARLRLRGYLIPVSGVILVYTLAPCCPLAARLLFQMCVTCVRKFRRSF